MKKRILIIDDDRVLNKINEKVLLVAGLVKELHIVENGRQAIDYLKTRLTKSDPLPEIIIFDLHLPIMDGFSFIDVFQEMEFAGKSNIELVVFTSSSNPRDRQKALGKGITHYLSKPYLLRGLSDIITRLQYQ